MRNLFTNSKRRKAIFASDLSSNLDQNNESIYASDLQKNHKFITPPQQDYYPEEEVSKPIAEDSHTI